jgi:hypothetical protein
MIPFHGVREDLKFVVGRADHAQEHSMAERRNDCERKSWEGAQGSIAAARVVSMVLAGQLAEANTATQEEDRQEHLRPSWHTDPAVRGVGVKLALG